MTQHEQDRLYELNNLMLEAMYALVKAAEAHKISNSDMAEKLVTLAKILNS